MEIENINIKDWGYAQALELSKESISFPVDMVVVSINSVEIIIDKIVAHHQAVLDRKDMAIGQMMKECDQIREQLRQYSLERLSVTMVDIAGGNDNDAQRA